MSLKVLAEVKNFLGKLKTMAKPSVQQMGLLDIMEIRVYDRDGRLKDMRRVVDLIVNAGLAEVAALLLTDVSGTAFDYIAIGTGTTSPSASDTALEYETHRVAATGSRVTTNVTNDTAQLVATFSGYSGTEAVTEAGVFNAASGGTLLCRQTFSALNVDWDAGDSIEITEKIVCQGA